MPWDADAVPEWVSPVTRYRSDDALAGQLLDFLGGHAEQAGVDLLIVLAQGGGRVVDAAGGAGELGGGRRLLDRAGDRVIDGDDRLTGGVVRVFGDVLGAVHG